MDKYFTPELIALYNAIVTSIGFALIAYNTYLSRRTEKNTNSMKDALVSSTAKASHAEGVAEGKASK